MSFAYRMSKFLKELYSTPSKAHLTAWLVATIGIVVVHLTGPSGEVKLSATTATELLLLTVTMLFSVCGVAYSYWKKGQPGELIELARKQGRPICHCTEFGVIMSMRPPPESDGAFRKYRCEKCGFEEFRKHVPK